MYLCERGDLCDRHNVSSKKIQQKHIINQYYTYYHIRACTILYCTMLNQL